MQFKVNFSGNTYHRHSDEELVVLIRSGNEPAFNELFERYGKQMYWYFIKMLNHDTEGAKDFLQDLFLKILEKSRDFNEEKKFKSWLYTIATNMCINEHNRKKFRHEKNDHLFVHQKNKVDHLQIEDMVDKKTILNQVMQIINKLNPETRSIFLLRFQEDMNIKQISEIVSLPEGTVKSRLFYIIKKLTQRFHNHLQQE